MPQFFMGITGDSGCKPPGDIWSDPTELADVSTQVERIIVGDFKGSKAASGAIDIFVDPGTNGPAQLTSWLSRNSFGRVLDLKKLKDGFDQSRYSVPDIITNRGTSAKSEFYEIKANSVTGKSAGLTQLAQFGLLNIDFQLLFFPGEDYDPVESRFHSVLSVGIYEYDLQLHWFRDAPGLILYEFCYKIKVKHRVLEIGIAVALALLAVLFFMMLKGRGANIGPTPQVA